MARYLVVAVALSLAITSCASDGGTRQSPSTSNQVATADTAASPDTTAANPVTSTAPAQPDTGADRPVAPDFTLALGDGGSYTLSEGSKPVYLVFWAEW